MAYNFVITTAGMAAATIAGSGGPKIDIVAFKLGAAFGYSPTAGDTGLNGGTIFTGVPLNITPYSSDTMDVVLQLGANDGPFQFGEIGIYLPGNVLFAKMAYPTIQTKLSDAVNGIGSTWNIHALLKLADAPALFNYTLSNNLTIPLVTGSAVLGPDSMGAGINAILAKDENGYTGGFETPILLKRVSSTEWAPDGYHLVTTFTPAAVATAGTTNITHTVFGPSSSWTNNATINHQYLLVDPNSGRIVPVSTINQSTSTAYLTRDVSSWLTTSTSLHLYQYADSALAPIASPQFTGTPSTEAPGVPAGRTDMGFKGLPVASTSPPTLTRSYRDLLIERAFPNDIDIDMLTVQPGDRFYAFNSHTSNNLTIQFGGNSMHWIVNGTPQIIPTAQIYVPPQALVTIVYLGLGSNTVLVDYALGGATGGILVTGTNGYSILPGGLMIQWGSIAGVGSVTSVPMTFTVPFPVACVGLNTTFDTSPLQNKAGNDNNATYANLTRFGCDIRLEVFIDHVFYVAWGY